MKAVRASILLLAMLTTTWAGQGRAEQGEVEQADYLTFARGALPVSIGGDADATRTGAEHALKLIDGNPGSFVITPKPGNAGTKLEFVFSLPARTTFTGFSVPQIAETPSPSQTFIARVEVLGSDEGQDSGFQTLAQTTLHSKDREILDAELEMVSVRPVRWVKLILMGGLDVRTDKVFLEFTEIVGRGDQKPVPNSDRFTGQWKGRGVLMELRQEGTRVLGCFDRTGELSGSVQGSMLYATGTDRNSGVLSSFVLTVTPAGAIDGVRSTNGAPFKRYSGDAAPQGTDTGCSEPVDSTLGCGSILYGIQFDFDSANIRPESDQVLAGLAAGLVNSTESAVTIVGHTSSEGSESYNQALSERRAQAVVDALISRGLEVQRLAAVGRGEDQPIASNEDEAGRALNRRVEVECRAVQ